MSINAMQIESHWIISWQPTTTNVTLAFFIFMHHSPEMCQKATVLMTTNKTDFNQLPSTNVV